VRARLSEDTTRLNGGRVLLGGSPLTLMRLSAAGAAVVDRLTDRSFVRLDQPAAESRLLGRLVDAGIVDVSLDPESETNVARRCTVVIPCHNDADGLAATLASCGPINLVVVDDASVDGDGIRTVVDQHNAQCAADGQQLARLVRLDVNGGPAAARNEGAELATTDVIVFIDAGVTWSEAWMATALAWFDDERCAVAAPRVCSTPGPSRLERYERDRSPLDLGSRGGPVGPGRRVAYVPSATLMVRRAAFVRSGGFDPTMRFGEDVDLVWRLIGQPSQNNDSNYSGPDKNFSCRYLGDEAVVEHRPRPSLAHAVRQRFGYGTAAGPLDRRHRGHVAPMSASKWSVAVTGSLVAGHPLVALVVSLGNAEALARKIAPLDNARRESARLVARGHLGATQQLLRAMIRPWWPITAMAAACSRRGRRLALVAAVVPPMIEWNRRRPELDPATWLALSLADDLSYSAGVWVGCWREHSIRALLPRFSEWPGAKN